MKRLLTIVAFCCVQHSVLGQTDSLTRFFYPDGTVSSEGSMVDGKPDGFWRTYHPNGLLKSEGNRAQQQLDSLWKFYTEEGIITQEITYRADKKNGLKRTYDEQGKLSRSEFYDNDVLADKVEYFHPSGKLKEVVPIDTLGRGKEHGIGYEFDEEDGRILSVVSYANGYVSSRERINRKDKFNQMQGMWKTFYPSMKVQTEGKYKNDKKHGYWKEFDENGNLMETLKYDEGILIADPEELAKLDIKKKFYPNAQVKSEGSYNKGVEEGVHRFYTLEGKVESAKIYRKGRVIGEGIVDAEGRRQGDWKEFYETGQLRSKGRYKDNKRTGPWIFYYEDGKVEQEGTYRDGKPDGNWKWTHRNGQTWREEVFFEGMEEGLAVEYSDSGTVVAKGEYLSGEREGKWIIDVGEHREEGEYRVGERTGVWKYYYRDEKLKYEGKFTDGREEGVHSWYYPSGQLQQQGRFKFGEKEGDWIDYNEDATIRMTVTYALGKVVKVDGSKAPVETAIEEEEQ
jgi:antitoxin component YwqK of YwqJK toxin-antitoxin module